MCLDYYMYKRPYLTRPETEAYREDLMRPPEPRGVNRAKECGLPYV